MTTINDTNRQNQESSLPWKPPTPDYDTASQRAFANKEEKELTEIGAHQYDISLPSPEQSDYGGTAEQSTVQAYWWSLSQLQPALPWLVMSSAAQLRRPLQISALQMGINALERQHDCLRTLFGAADGVGMRRVQLFQERSLNIRDITSSDLDEFGSLLKSEQAIPFNLETEPGWRVTLYRCSKENHILVVTLHRILSETMNSDLILSEISRFYSAALQQGDRLQGAESAQSSPRGSITPQEEQPYEMQLRFWKSQLEGSRPAEFLLDKARPAVLSGDTEKQSFIIQSNVWKKMQRFCQQQQVLPFVVLLAAFRIAHYRLSGASDGVISAVNGPGSQEAHTTGAQDLNTMDCFRIGVDDKDSFQQVVRQIHAINGEIETSARPCIPFEHIVSELRQMDQDLSRHPLAHILFHVHSESETHQLTFEDIESESLFLPIASLFDMELHLYPRDESVQVEVRFSPHLFRAETIKNVLSIFNQVLDRGVNNPEASVETLDLMTQDEYEILHRMNLLQVHASEYPRDLSVVDVFRKQANMAPERIAVKDSSCQMTYAELDKQSSGIASWLKRQSLSPETLVGVFAPRSCQTIAAFMGILKAGLAYLPFDTTTPYGRMETILSSIEGHTIVLVGTGISPPTIKGCAKFVQLSDIVEEFNQSTEGLQEMTTYDNIAASRLAYVMFTSGSTGRPKGVMVEHRGIVRLVKGCNMAEYLPQHTTMAHVTSIAFDNSTWEIYAPLLNGGTLVCIDSASVLDCGALSRVFLRERVQSVMLTPALLKQYLIGCPEAIAVLEMMCIQGEKADVEDMVLARRLSGGTVINAYGPTENTVTSTFFVLSDQESCVNGVPIGQPLSNSGAYVMDVNQKLVPLGVLGELVVTGDGLARGYTDPERNVDRFISVTIGGRTAKAYRTGDYVRYRPTDGQLEFFGRIDGQVKIHGHRIELGEIEHVMRSHEYVTDAVVVVQSEGKDARLAGYITLRDIRPGSIEESSLVETWLDHWDVETYTPMDKVQQNEVGRDFIGWTSMHDGSDIPRVEMNEWLDETIDTILDGSPAGHVLEVGTGSGMILFNLKKGLESYVGLEPSGKAVDFVIRAAASIPELADKVTMHKGTAGDIRQLKIANPPDTAVLNSVSQYFPSQDYLIGVLQSLIDVGAKRIFVGDVRSYALHKEFLAARALFIAGDRAISREEFKRIMADVEKAESELLLDPAFFTSLPRRLSHIEHVEILPKTVQAINELSCYRYAAVLHIKQSHARRSTQFRDINRVEWVDFMAQHLDRRSLSRLLYNSIDSPFVAIKNIPDSKTILERSILESLNTNEQLGDGKWAAAARQKAQQRPSMSTTDLILLAQQTGWRVELSWARQHSQNGSLDAIFYRNQQPADIHDRLKFRFPIEGDARPYSSLSSHPLRREARRKVQDQLHQILQARLPSYMIPHFFTFLDKMPVNQNSKVDRKTIATYVQSQTAEQGQKQEPTSRAERRVRQIWGRVLNINPHTIGRNDSFFSLGGDSIAAMMAVSESRKVGVKIAVADIFRWPVLHQLARQTEAVADDTINEIEPFALLGDDVDVESLLRDVSTSCGISSNIVQDVFPCTPLQEGLIFETLKRPGGYLRQAVIELAPNISEKRLVRAWEAVIRAKAILRTRIVQHHQLGLLQVVVEEQPVWTDATAMGLPAYLDADKKKSMDLGQPLSRYALIKDAVGVPRWLIWSANHALYDGWSLHLLQDALYQAYRNTSAQIESGPQFQSFIKYVKGRDTDEAAAYWQRVLLDCDCRPFPSLPPTVEHPVADTIIRDFLPLPPNLGSDITASTLIRAAWGLVMGQMTNSDDVVFGMTLYGRNAPVAGLDKMAAPTIATVPVRVQLGRSQTCSDYLAMLQQGATEMIPFEQTGLQNIARLVSSGQDSCKFQTQLVVQAGEDHCNECPFGEWQQGSEEQGFTTYAFTLELWLHPDKIATTAMFDSRAIEPWLVRRMIARLESVMGQLAKALPTQTLSYVQVSVPEDLQQIWQWNEMVPAPVEKCVHEIFEQQAQLTPNAPAIFAWDGKLTYGELDELSARVAEELVSLGVGPEIIVPLCFEKSMWTAVAVLGVLKAGGAFVLLEPTLPEHRLKEIIRQVQGNLVLSSALNKGLASELAEETVTLDWNFFDAPTTRMRSLNARSCPTPSSAAYLVFTSGSTGTPKGVEITHGNLASALHYQVELMGLTSTSRLYDFASYSFDVSISNMFTVLAAGGCLCVPSDEDRKEHLEESIRCLEANALDLTPSVAQLLSPSRLPQVRSLVLGGEALRVSDIAQWWNAGNVKIRNAYGPCECTPTSVINHSASSLEETARIGKGAGVVTWVVNPEDYDELLPPGCTGELLLEGPLVGRGYLNDPDKTTASFIEDPAWLLNGTPGKPGRRGRLYKTGDLVRYNEHGSLIYVSRKDEQVKIRGQRVELGEIEHALRSQDGIDDAVAVVQGNKKENACIAAFITVSDMGGIQEEDVDDREEAEQQIKSWESQFDGDTYASMEAIQPTEIGRDFVGWNSMIDGKEFDNGDMNEWLDDTVRTILNGNNSLGQVLEIGTGSGMILFNLADNLRSYIGLEPSERAVDFVAQTAASVPQLKDKVKIFKATAADLPRLALDTPLSPDIVIINSVLQYFPSQEYLFDVIKEVVNLGSVKTMFFGDVRSYVLHREFLAMRALHAQGNASKEELEPILSNMQRSEPELLVDPGFFTSLPDRLPGSIGHVEILPKIMKATNELSCYRYAAVVHLSSELQQPALHISEAGWTDFKEQNLDCPKLSELLGASSAPATLAISNIPYSKVAFPRAIIDSLENQNNTRLSHGDWLSAAREEAERCKSLDPIALVELAQRAGYRVELSWARQSSQRGGLDAVFYRHAESDDMPARTLFCFPQDHHGRAHHTLSSQPLRPQTENKIRQKVSKRLKTQLPSYMLPQSITILDRMPITKNGKVDRKMLAESGQMQTGSQSIKDQPMAPLEKQLQSIWSEVLNIKSESIGLHDGFIQLGGNSLGAMKVVTMARQAGIKLAVTDMFRHSITSIHQLSLQLSAAPKAEEHLSAPQGPSAADLLAEIDRYDARIAAIPLHADFLGGGVDARCPQPRKSLTVLLTGANGFIGVQILRQLLEHREVGRVIALVRGESAETAKKRLVDAAKKALWWTEFHDENLEVWPGDLSLPHLGLGSAHWNLIESGTVDIIIHNGASVHFMKSYEVLKAANVESTAELLRVTASNPQIRFVYVSSPSSRSDGRERRSCGERYRGQFQWLWPDKVCR